MARCGGGGPLLRASAVVVLQGLVVVLQDPSSCSRIPAAKAVANAVR